MSNRRKVLTEPMDGGASPRKVAPGRVISQVDPEARHTRKSAEARRDGYRAHVVAEAFLSNDSAAGSGTRRWYGDSAYDTGDLRGAIQDADMTG